MAVERTSFANGGVGRQRLTITEQWSFSGMELIGQPAETPQRVNKQNNFTLMYHTMATLHEYRTRYPDRAANPTLTQRGLLGGFPDRQQA